MSLMVVFCINNFSFNNKALVQKYKDDFCFWWILLLIVFGDCGCLVETQKTEMHFFVVFYSSQ